MRRSAETPQPKTPGEVARIAEGGAILKRALREVVEAARPGVTGAELDRLAEEQLRAAGAEPSFKGYRGKDARPFPASLCVSVNSAIVHGLPTDAPLNEGDVVGLDLGARYKGLYTDAATTIIVGKGTSEAERLIAVTKAALRAGIAAVRPGATTGDIGSAIQRTVEAAGFSVVRDLTGHGVGYAVHEAPRVPCFGSPGTGDTLVEGLVIAIEPMVIAGPVHRVQVADDGWTVVAADPVLTAHEEDTVVVTRDGARVLTVPGPTVPSMRQGVVLAIDHGDARIGVAVTDTAREHALAHSAIPAEPPDEALAALRRLIAAEQIELVIVGLPLTLEGGEGPQAAVVRAFGERLGAATGLPVEYVDERFTSGEAEAAARAKGTEPDAEAARLILEAWLAQQR